jgi:hypothetical protein
MRRGTITAGALVVALAGGFGVLRLPAADDKQPDHRAHHSAEMEKCLKECVRCAKECESCFNHCVMMVSQGHKEHVRTLKTCNDCGDFCALAAKLIARDGAFLGLSCEGCAKACDQCEAECQKHSHDEQMKRCAEACKDCAKACRDMVKAVGTGSGSATE